MLILVKLEALAQGRLKLNTDATFHNGEAADVGVLPDNLGCLVVVLAFSLSSTFVL